MAKILITGGLGFIGFNLAKKLKRLKNEIIIVDNLSTAPPERFRLASELNFDTVVADICDYAAIQHISCEQVYHLGSRASPKQYQKDPLHTLDTNYTGTKNVLNLAKKNGAKVVFTSSSEVYGEAQQHPQPETYFGYVNTLSERSCYTEGKRIAETLCYEFQSEVNIRIARLFNTYGPGMCLNDGRVIPNFISQAIHQKPLTIYGDGSQTRSLVYIDDLLDGLIRLMALTQPKMTVVNLGNDQEKSILSIASLVQNLSLKMTHYRPDVNFLPLPESDPVRRKPDLLRAKTLLGWTAKTQIQHGLDRTWHYLYENMKTEQAVS